MKGESAPEAAFLPAVSIVIPTGSRRTLLLDLLGALRNQGYPADRIEVIAVVNGSADDTAEALGRFEAPWRLRAALLPAVGAAAARNRGAEEASGDVVLFLDDDILPGPRLVEEHARAHAEARAHGGRIAAIGPYYPSHGRAGDFFRIHVRNWWEDLYRGIASEGHRTEYRDLLAGNFSIERGLFGEIGGFPADFARCDGEDWELGIRLVRAGVPIRFLPEAHAEHRDDETMTQKRSFVRARRSGRGDARVRRRHPEFREKLGPPAGRAWDFSIRRVPIRLARRVPAVGDLLARSLVPLLAVFESLRMRRSWRNLYHLIRGYWHWRGYFEEERLLGPIGDAAPTAEGAAAGEGAPQSLEVDLENGIEAAAAAFDRERPRSARVYSGGRFIGAIPDEPGTEPLRGVHLRAELAGRLAGALVPSERGGERATTMEVSVIIPARNAAETLPDTIAALRAQTLGSWEAIIVENGSTDDTPEVAAKLASRDVRVRLIRSGAAGVGAARNEGIRAARHPWLLFLDADDWIQPTFLERMAHALGNDPSLDGIYCGYERRTAGGEHTGDFFYDDPGDLFLASTRYCMWVIHSVVFRRSSAEAAGGFPVDMATCEDWLFWQRVLRTGARIGRLPEHLAVYRVRPTSASMNGYRMAEDAVRVVRIGHRRDDAVLRPKGEYAEGAPSDREARALLRAVAWPAAVMIGAGEDGRRVLDLVGDARDPSFDPSVLAYCVRVGAPLPRSLPESAWPRFWPEIETNALLFFEAFERRSGAPDLARRALNVLTGLILSGIEPGGPFSIGNTRFVDLDLSEPLPDVLCGSTIERLRCALRFQGYHVGHVVLPVSDGSVPAAVLADAIADEHAWSILDRYWDLSSERGLRWGPLLAPSIGRRLTRSIARLLGKKGKDFEGWAIATIGRAALEREIFSGGWRGGRVRPEGGAPLRVDLCGRIPEVRSDGPAVRIALEFAGLPIGSFRPLARGGKVSARALRTGALLACGHEIVRLAAREALIGRSLLDGAGLKKRLRQAWEARGGPSASEADIHSSIIHSYTKNPDRAFFLARRDGAAIGTSASRRAALPAAAEEALAESARAHGEALLPPRQGPPVALFYAPELARPLSLPDGAEHEVAVRPRAVSDRERAAATLVRTAQRIAPSLRARLGGRALADRLPILMYHRVADAGVPALARYRVARAAFEAEMRYLAENGYRAIRLEDWEEARTGRMPIRGRAVLLTFDDGYRDFRTDAWPILRRYGLTATVFLAAGRVGGSADWDAPYGEPPPLLTAEEIRGLRDEGVAFGSHTYNHVPLTGLSPRAIVEEAARSRAAIREILGAPVSAIAYPYGDHDPCVRHLAGAAGYAFGLTCDRSVARYSDPLLALPRIEVEGTTTIEEFARLLLPERKGPPA